MAETQNYRYEGTGLSLPHGYVPRGEVLPIETNDDGMITDPVMAPFADALYSTDADATVEYDRNDRNRTADDLPPGYQEDVVAVQPAGVDTRFRPVVDSTTAGAAGTTDSQTQQSATDTSGTADPTADTPDESASEVDESDSAPVADTTEGANNPPATADDGNEQTPTLDESTLNEIEERGDRETAQELAREYDEVDARQSTDTIVSQLRNLL